MENSSLVSDAKSFLLTSARTSQTSLQSVSIVETLYSNKDRNATTVTKQDASTV